MTKQLYGALVAVPIVALTFLAVYLGWIAVFLGRIFLGKDHEHRTDRR